MGIELVFVAVKLPLILERDVLDQKLDGSIPVLIRSLWAHGCHKDCLLEGQLV